MNRGLIFTLFILVAFLRLSAQSISSFKRLTNVIDSYPMFSPDGKQIAFESNRTGNFEIYIINADGTNIKQLTSDTAFDGTPAWSPDGKQIVFIRTSGIKINQFILPISKLDLAKLPILAVFFKTKQAVTSSDVNLAVASLGQTHDCL